MNKFNDFFRAFDKNRIFLPEGICQQLDEFLQGMRKRVIHFGGYVQIKEHAPLHVVDKKFEVWTEASDYFSAELPTARRALEDELRAMLAAMPNTGIPAAGR